MYLTVVRIFPSAEKTAAVRQFLEGLLGPTRVQQGCLGCTLAVESHPEALVLTETWQSEDDLLHRLRSDEYAKVLATMELSTRQPEVFIYQVVDQRGMKFLENARMADQIAGTGR